MKILMVYPVCPDTFWSFRHALKFVRKRASGPPLGLLTVAALLPSDWDIKLVDMNVERLLDKNISDADFVFIGAMSIQRESAIEVIQRCNLLGKKIVAGGPLFTAHYEDFPTVDHFVLNEAELTLPAFLSDLSNGSTQRVYTTTEFAELRATPIPLWHLIKMKHYATMNIQYSRGCPYDCHFCDITVLYGKKPRTKSAKQLLDEFDSLLKAGWRSNVFLVDDNFIGNKRKIKQEVLPALIEWMEQNNHPFALSTEASMNLADDEELMNQMSTAGFDTVFIGIESPNENSLIECDKKVNRNRDLAESVHKIQSAGLQIQGGFIVGFDNDTPAIFKQVTRFIQETGIVTAMVGMLNAPKGTKLHAKLLSEGRLLNTFSGSNTDFSLNFVPKMNPETLVEGYRSILEKIYAPKHYYARVKRYLRDYKIAPKRGYRIRLPELNALLRSIVVLGVIGKERFQYWKLFFWSLLTRPTLFPHSITLAIYGFHFRKIVESSSLNCPAKSLRG